MTPERAPGSTGVPTDQAATDHHHIGERHLPPARARSAVITPSCAEQECKG